MINKLVLSIGSLLLLQNAFALQPWCTHKNDDLLSIYRKHIIWKNNTAKSTTSPSIKFDKDIYLPTEVDPNTNKYVRKEAKSEYKKGACFLKIDIRAYAAPNKNVLIKKDATLTYSKNITSVSFTEHDAMFTLETDKLAIYIYPKLEIGHNYFVNCTAEDLQQAMKKAGMTFSYYHPEGHEECMIESLETDVISTREEETQNDGGSKAI